MPSVAAQADDPVYLVTGSNRKSDCRTWTVTSRNRNFDNSNQSAEEACEGGVVWAEWTTRGEAESMAATSSSTLVSSIVSVTGDDAQDTANVQQEMRLIHETFANQFLATGGTTTDAGDSEATTQGCQRGSTDTFKRKHMVFKANLADAYVRARVEYSRETCQLWKFDGSKSKLEDSANRPVRSWMLRYTDVWWGGNDFRFSEKILDCERLSTGNWITDQDPGWKITTGGFVEYAVIADSDIYVDPGCWYNGGKEYTTGWVLLKGPNR